MPRFLRAHPHSISLHPRLWLSLALMVLVYGLLPHLPYSAPLVQLHTAARVLLAWNVGALFYIVACLRLMRETASRTIQSRVEQEDDGRFFVLFVVIASTAAILFAVPAQIDAVKASAGQPRGIAHLVLAVGTVVSSWAFTQISFALHYAHDYYHARWRGQAGGLAFPDTEEPDYGDFLYFSAIIGTSAQTADININARPMRRLVLLHCVQAFFFNTMLLAIVINMAAGVFTP